MRERLSLAGWLALGQTGTATLALVGLLAASALDGWIVPVIVGAWVLSLLMLGGVFGPARLRAVIRAGVAASGASPLRLRLVLIILALGGVALLFVSPVNRLPPPALFLPFALLWPWLTAALLVHLGDPAAHRSTRFFNRLVGSWTGLVILALLLEAGLRLLLPVLPRAWLYPLPASLLGLTPAQRIARDLGAEANRVYDYPFDPAASGDLFATTCLPAPEADPADALTIRYTRDEFGFRNTSPWPSDVTVAVSGDSFVDGFHVNDPFWWGVDPGVIALSESGFGTFEEAIVLREYGLPATPDVVVLVFFGGNDLEDNWRFSVVNGPEFLGTYTPGGHLLSLNLGYWFLRQATYRQETADESGDCAYPVQDSLGTPLAFLAGYVAPLAVPADVMQASGAWAVTREAVLSASADAQAAGARLMIAYIPPKAQVHWPLLLASGQAVRAAQYVAPVVAALPGGLAVPASSPQDVADLITANLGTQAALLAELATEAGTDFLDFTPSFQDAAAAGEVLYYYGDTHWNQAGHDLARGVLRDFLAENDLLAE